jgi:DNA-directed RNA polymerase specialized sigma24 family protein
MVDALWAEIMAFKGQQRVRQRGDSFAPTAHKLAQAAAVLQAEIRKTGDDADKAVSNLPPNRRVELILKMIRDLSPEHRAAIRVYLDELGLGLM